MQAISFPNFFANAKTNTKSDRDAIKLNLLLLLASNKLSLFGDPYFGTNLRRLIYDLNNTILQDLVIDEIYCAILDFMPDIYVTRDNITLIILRYNISVQINCINRLDMTNDLYTIKLTSEV